MQSSGLLRFGVLFVAVVVTACASPVITEESKPGELQFLSLTKSAAVTDAGSTGGVSWVDYDDDGDLDLFVTNGYDVSASEASPQINRLYRNVGGGTLEPLTEVSIAMADGYSSGHSWGDYDNDGDLDLFVANQRDQNNFLYRNDGENFTRQQEGAPVSDGGHSYAAAWIDVDRDGALDLFVANGGLSHSGANFLYRNTGDAGFERVTDGAIVTDEQSTCGFAWGDYDNDGDPDLFVANQGFDSSKNNNALYRNEGDWVFTKMTDSPAVEDHQASASANWIDYDNDGDLDLYVANLYGLANLLYDNDGSGQLTQVFGTPITVDGGYSSATNWEDYDNDGDVDLLIANWGSAPDLYLNDGLGNLERVRVDDLGRMIEYTGSMASGDYDDDGDLDVCIGNWPNNPGPEEQNHIYVNQGVSGNWLQVNLVGTESNRSGIGARVIVTTESNGVSRKQMREVHSHTGFRGQSSLIQHFGLAGAESAAEVEVYWPSGAITHLDGVQANQRKVITEAQGVPGP